MFVLKQDVIAALPELTEGWAPEEIAPLMFWVAATFPEDAMSVETARFHCQVLLAAIKALSRACEVAEQRPEGTA